MRILIVEDSNMKIKWIERILKERGIEYEQISYLNEAYNKILSSESFSGIILDMQFPIYTDSKVKGNAGVILLEKLKRRNIKIPVLGNSTIRFPSSNEYPFFKGQLDGYETLDGTNTLLKFLESIEQQS